MKLLINSEDEEGVILSCKGVELYLSLKGYECSIFGLNEELIDIGESTTNHFPVLCFSEKLTKFSDIPEISYEESFFDPKIYNRQDPILYKVFETLGADGFYVSVKLIEIPDDVDWFIDTTYYGEIIREKHRTWS